MSFLKVAIENNICNFLFSLKLLYLTIGQRLIFLSLVNPKSNDISDFVVSVCASTDKKNCINNATKIIFVKFLFNMTNKYEN